MTIKWVASDPLVMNGEPFCYGTRLTVRNLLEMRSHGLTPSEMLAQHPELKRVGIAEAFRFATENPDRYEGFFERDGFQALALPQAGEARFFLVFDFADLGMRAVPAQPHGNFLAGFRIGGAGHLGQVPVARRSRADQV